jgi:hypothetical protein
MTSLTVETIDFRQALQAVTPHAGNDPELPVLMRVRLEVGPQNLTVSATQRYTLGHAIVTVWDNHDGELATFDLSPTDVKEILALFRGRPGDDDGPSNQLRLDVTDEHFKITDVSGLFEGKSLSLPRYPFDENFPKVTQLIAKQLTAPAEGAEQLITNGKMLGLFMKAASAYEKALVIEPAGNSKAMMISCGESFIGILMPIKPDDDLAAEIKGWHLDWLMRLQDLNVAAG